MVVEEVENIAALLTRVLVAPLGLSILALVAELLIERMQSGNAAVVEAVEAVYLHVYLL